MVADVGHADPADINPVAERFANVADPHRRHRHTIDHHGAPIETHETGPSRKGVESHREHRCSDNRRHRLIERATIERRRRAHRDAARLVEHRRKERQPLDVIPMEVGHQTDHLASRGDRGIARSGTEVEEDQRLIRRVDTDTRSVTPVARRLLTVACGRAPHPVEGHRDRAVSDARTLATL